MSKVSASLLALTVVACTLALPPLLNLVYWKFGEGAEILDLEKLVTSRESMWAERSTRKEEMRKVIGMMTSLPRGDAAAHAVWKMCSKVHHPECFSDFLESLAEAGKYDVIESLVRRSGKQYGSAKDYWELLKRHDKEPKARGVLEKNASGKTQVCMELLEYSEDPDGCLRKCMEYQSHFLCHGREADWFARYARLKGRDAIPVLEEYLDSDNTIQLDSWMEDPGGPRKRTDVRLSDYLKKILWIIDYCWQWNGVPLLPIPN
ncbi:MAG TPA: hypothetical protein PK668_00820 [Myxococcota bacterium]|nr:hypothetical protein [Myxococcota bacterium]HRY95625.1 hypothetical protein [Myxococcota bacterium]HSA20350.1 hypothetical protein [Myxococcota bacterium]